MIDATHNFEQGVEFLSNDLDKGIAQNLVLQNNFLDSQQFNETMKNIEDELNLLYEKTRVLEDIIAYSKEFLEQQIHINKELLYDKLETIEDIRDTIKDKAYVLFRAPLKQKNAGIIRDRDGTVLDHCEIDNGNLALSAQDLEDIRVIDVTKKQELIAYNDNLKDVKDTGHYRTYYLLDGPATHGVKEEIIFLFDDIKRVNYINASAVNCNIVNATLINENGAEESVIALESSTIAEKKLRGVKLTIVSNNYETIPYDIDMKRIHGDFWNKIAVYEYNRTLGKASTFDLQKLSGMAQHKEDYQAYLKELEEWKKEKEEVKKRNALKMMKYADQ